MYIFRLEDDNKLDLDSFRADNLCMFVHTYVASLIYLYIQVYVLICKLPECET